MAATLCGREREAADALTSLQDFGGRTSSMARAIGACDGGVMSDSAYFPPPNGNNHRRGLENIGPDAAPYLGLDTMDNFGGYAPFDSGVVVNTHHYGRPSHLQHHPTDPSRMQQAVPGHLPQPTTPFHLQQPMPCHLQHLMAPFHVQQPAPGHMQHPMAPFHVQQPVPGHSQQQHPLAPFHVQEPALGPKRLCRNCRDKGKICGGLCACPKGCHGDDGCTRHRQANHSTKAGSRLCKDCRLRRDLPCRPCGSYVKRVCPGGEVVLMRRKKQESVCAHRPVAKRRKVYDDLVTTDDSIANGSLHDFGDASGVPANTSGSDEDDNFNTNAVADHDSSLHGDVAGEGSTSGPYLCYQIVTPEDPLPDEDLFRGLKDRVGQILQLHNPGSEGHPWDNQLCYWPYITNRIMDNVYIYQLYQGKLDNDSIREALRLLKMAIRRLNAIDLTYGYDLIVNPVDLRAYLIRCAGILEADARKQGLIQ